MPHELTFTHPLYRAAIYADLSPTSRRELHARAAEVVAGGRDWPTGPRRRVGPDEALAGELEASALATPTGDLGASAWALEQAAALSPGRAAGKPVARRRRHPAQRRGQPAAARVLASCQAPALAVTP